VAQCVTHSSNSRSSSSRAFSALKCLSIGYLLFMDDTLTPCDTNLQRKGGSGFYAQAHQSATGVLLWSVLVTD
jgi:hypothetical protein